jgi:hypothetical protein
LFEDLSVDLYSFGEKAVVGGDLVVEEDSGLNGSFLVDYGLVIV